MKTVIGILGLALLTIVIHSCKKEVPEVITGPITNITATTATCGGKIVNDGGSPIVSAGLFWFLSVNPTGSYSKSVDGPAKSEFTSTITGLMPGTSYYIRSFATNAIGTGYGEDVLFTTQKLTATDADGNIYHSVSIGNQVWLVENLKTSRYRNGDLIGTTTPAEADISSETSPKYQWIYPLVENYLTDYGRLYTWYTISDSRNICPEGWHIPSDNDWAVLIDFISPITGTMAAIHLKESRTNHWKYETGATNTTGFTALPGGSRWITGTFEAIGDWGHWWSSTESGESTAWARSMISSGEYSSFVLRNESPKNIGFSVRCIMDK